MIRIRTSSGQTSQVIINSIIIPFSYTSFLLSVLSRATAIDILYAISNGTVEIESPSQLEELYQFARVEKPSTEIVLTSDPYEFQGNNTYFFSTIDNNIGKDGDVLHKIGTSEVYRKENGVFVLKSNYSNNAQPGAKWFYSTSVDNSIGVNGDFLLKPDGKVYEKVSGSYLYRTSIRGSDGVGIDGTPGAAIYIGTSTNVAGDIRNGDLLIVNQDELYKRESGVWVLKGSIKGSVGLKGDTGNTGRTPIFRTFNGTLDNSIGLDGDILLNDQNYKFYRKDNDTYTYLSTLTTPEGTIIRSGGAPDDNIGKDLDYFITDNGELFKRIGGEYQYQFRITGQTINFTTPSPLLDGDVLIKDNKIQRVENGVLVDKATFNSKIYTTNTKTSEDLITFGLTKVESLELDVDDGILSITNAGNISLLAGRYKVKISILGDVEGHSVNIKEGTSVICSYGATANISSNEFIIERTGSFELEVFLDTEGNIIKAGNVSVEVSFLSSATTNQIQYLSSNNKKYKNKIKTTQSVNSNTFTITTDNNYAIKEKYELNIGQNTLISLAGSSRDGKSLSITLYMNGHNVVWNTTNIDLNGYTETQLNTFTGKSIVIFKYILLEEKWRISVLAGNI